MDNKDEKESTGYGNIWGWKYSYYALYFILFCCAMLAWRYYSLDEKGRQELFQEQEDVFPYNKIDNTKDTI